MATATLKIEGIDFRLLRLNEVLTLIPVSRASFYEGIEKGHYPKPLKVGKEALCLEAVRHTRPCCQDRA